MESARFKGFDYNGKLIQKKIYEYVPLQLLIYLGKFALTEVDLIVVSNLLGKQMLAAMDTYRTFQLLLFTVVVMLETGIPVVYSNTLGKNSPEKLNAVNCSIFFLQLFVCGFIALVQLPLFRLYLKPISLDLSTIDLCWVYARSMFFALLLDAWNTLWIAQLVSAGRVRIVAVLSLLAGGMNVAFDILFIKVLDLGIRGAGYSSVLSCFIYAVIMLIYLLRKTDLLKFRIVKCWKTMILMFRSGGPEFINQFFLIAFRYLTTLGITLCLAEDGLAAKAVCSFCYNLAFCFIEPFRTIMNQFAGMYYASKNKKGLYLLSEKLTLYTTCCAVLITSVLFLFPVPFFRLFGYETVTATDIAVFRIYSICILLDMAISVLLLYFNGTLQQKRVYVMNIIGRVLEALALAFTVYVTKGASVFIVYSIPSVVNIVMCVFLYRKQKKKDAAEIKNASVDRLYFSFNSGNVSSLTEQIDTFLRMNGKEKRLINYISLVVEEYVSFVIRNNPQKQTDIDICIMLYPDRISLLFWDNGKPTDISLSSVDPEEFYEDQMLSVVSDKIQHSIVYDLNFYTFTVSATEKKTA